MKKKFYPLHIGFLALCMIACGFMIAFGIWYIVMAIKSLIVSISTGAFFGLVLSLIALVIGFVKLFGILRIKLIVRDDRIDIKGEFKLTANSPAAQRDDSIFFDEIENIALIYAHGDSKGKRIKTYTAGQAVRANFFFEFMLKDGGIKRLYIEPYAKWQRKQLLAIINERTGHNFSYETLERRDESMFARKKKK